MESSSRRHRNAICLSILVVAAIISNMAFMGSNAEAAPIATCTTNGCTIGNAYGFWPDRIPCHAASVVYPKSEKEIMQAVAYAAKHNFKIKPGSRHSHSMCKIMCPGGNDGIFLSTSSYASIVSIDKRAMTVTAQAGTQFKDLVDTIAKAGLALSNAPYWSGLSLAGLLSTAAHGSSLFGRGGAIHEYVIGMRIVVPAPASQGYAKVNTLNDGDEDLKAARVSLGVLGVISTVTLQLEPLFKRHVILDVEDDADLENRILQFSKQYEFADVRWFPSQHKVIYRKDKRVPLSTPGNGVNNNFRGSPKSGIEAARVQEDQAEASRRENPKCSVAKSSLNSSLSAGGGFANYGNTFTGYPVIGFQHKMQTSEGCSSNNEGLYCGWDRRIKGRDFFETSTYAPVRSLPNLIKDVKTLRAKVPGSFCNVDAYDSGILMRFIKKSDRAYLGAAPLEDVAEVNFDFYRAYDASTPKLDEDIPEELEQICLHKYGARPHWGKNRNVAFTDIAKTYPGMQKFLRVKKKYDPRGLFSSEWSDAILGINKNASTYKPFCALEGLCICKSDEHCNPEKNSFCRPGRVFSQARVCRYESRRY